MYCNWDAYFVLCAIAAPACAAAVHAYRTAFAAGRTRRQAPGTTHNLAAALFVVWLTGLGYIWICMVWGNGWQQALQLTHRCMPGDAHAMPAVNWDSKTAVAYVCIGKGCALDQLQAAVTSLRRCGEWGGAVYVVTDRPDAVVPACGRWGEGSAVKALVVDSQGLTMMEIKHMKQRLFSLAPAKHGTLMYLDVDVLTVSPVQGFVASVMHDNGGRIPAMAMFRDNVCANCNRFNCGVVVMQDVPETKRCMAAWSTEMAQGSYQRHLKEQDALDTVLAQGHCASIEGLSSQRIVYATGPVRAWFKLTALPVAFVHLTHSWRESANGKHVLAQLQHTLGLIATSART